LEPCFDVPQLRSIGCVGVKVPPATLPDDELVAAQGAGDDPEPADMALAERAVELCAEGSRR
jgi:hypothetical protein